VLVAELVLVGTFDVVEVFNVVADELLESEPVPDEKVEPIGPTLMFE